MKWNAGVLGNFLHDEGWIGLMRWNFMKLAENSIDLSTLDLCATTGPRDPIKQ